MTRARKQQISLSDTPYYHCVNRCVRRAYLFGEDRDSGRSYAHRKQWIVDRIQQLSSVFAIDVCAYAVMDNHYHVVLRVDAARLAAWPNDEVLKRWTLLFAGNFLVQRYLQGETLSAAELVVVQQTASEWRARLLDISWFMRCLNEPIARKANQEDKVKGRFWEGRFKSQALLDEQALLSCMMYVDLNPVRAGVAQVPEQSEFTSIYERIQALAEPKKRGRPRKNPIDSAECLQAVPAARLSAFADRCRASEKSQAIPFNESDYLQLLDWTGRAIRADKRGAIPPHLRPILVRLGMEDEQSWIDNVSRFNKHYACYAGNADSLQQAAARQGRRWVKGCGNQARKGTGFALSA